jgi:hypothetical protein
MSQLQQSAVRNRLLAALPPNDFAALAPVLDPVQLELRQVLYEPGQAIRAVLFPENGMISNIVLLEDGHSVEVGIIGREGLVGLPVVLGAERSSTETLVQFEGSRLAPDHREVLALHAVHALRYKPIAAICRCEIGTVKSRISRARNLLRQMLLGEDDCNSLHAPPLQARAPRQRALARSNAA